MFRAIGALRLVCADLGRLTVFYRAIGFKVGEVEPIPAAQLTVLCIDGGGSRRSMALGKSRIDLDCFDQKGRPYPEGATASDLVFQHFALVTDNIRSAWERARNAGATPISREEPVTLPQSAGGVTAIKFRDPEGHPLELLQFPPGCNSSQSERGILGIDHTAISVGNVRTSRRFYEEHGLALGESTINQGPEQDALDGLDGVKVDVVPMNPAETPPHVELLGYRVPFARQNNSFACNDIAATRMVWRSDRNALVRDPDGHLLELIR